MPAKFATAGYGQVEPNRLTASIDGNFESQAPAYTDKTGTTPVEELENGMFLCAVVDTAGVSPMGRLLVLPGQAPETATAQLVFSERKVYDERQTAKDYVDKASEKVDGILYPRTFQLSTDNDVYTTNCINEEPDSLSVGDILYVGDDGYLSTTPGVNKSLQFAVIKVYTMPSGLPGVKVMAQDYVAV